MANAAKDIAIVVLLGALTLIALLWLTDDSTPVETVVVMNPSDAWWNLPKDELEKFIREQIARADVVRVAVFENHERVNEVEIRDRAELRQLADQFTIETDIQPPGAFLGARITRIEICGTTKTRLELGRTWLMYGPSGGAKLEQWVDEGLIPSCWHTVSVTNGFYEALGQHIGVALY